MKLVILSFLWITLNAFDSNQSIFDPRVYNFYYYVQHNPSVIQSQIYTEQQAANHWSSIGIVEGLQACGEFHVLQFINNYPSLINKACPSPQQNYSCAVYYYLTNGYNNNLHGYTVGGSYNKNTISTLNSTFPQLGLYASVSNRMGGSIDSLIYNNFEYINAFDHQRNIQIEGSINNENECYQFQESGSINDKQNNSTTSKIIDINSTDKNIYTQINPAFALSAGSECAVNKVNVSNYTISKNIYYSFGYQNIWFIHYVTSIYITDSFDVLKIKGPIITLNYELNSFWKLTNTGNGEIYPVDIKNDGSTYKVTGDGMGPSLLIVATNDTKNAISMVPIIPQSCNGGIWIQNNLGTSEYKVNASTNTYLEFIYYNVTAGTNIDLDTVICVGTLEDIQMCTGFAY